VCAAEIEAMLEPQHLAFELTLGEYGGILEKAIQAYKFHNTPRLHVLFADLLARELRKARYMAAQGARVVASPDSTHHQNQTLTPWQIDVVCAVPLHWQRHLQRGYNQAALLAHRIAKAQDIPYQRLLSRPRATQQQAKLDADARLDNISGAFRAKPATGKRVLLVDDVLTTRATTTECALTLLEAGAACVYCVGIVRANH
jgi:ComF family protein